jgi:hypothetical protein
MFLVWNFHTGSLYSTTQLYVIIIVDSWDNVEILDMNQ